MSSLERILTNATGLAKFILLFGLWVVLTLAITLPVAVLAVPGARPLVLPAAAVVAYMIVKRFDR